MLPLPACFALRELLLEVPGVEKDELGELACAVGRDDWPAEAFVDDVGNQPAVVEMSVGQEDRVERRRVEPERDPVPDGLVRAALEHPAVDEDSRPLGDEQELGAGDGRGAAEEVDLHRRIVPRRSGMERPSRAADVSARSRPDA